MALKTAIAIYNLVNFVETIQRTAVPEQKINKYIVAEKREGRVNAGITPTKCPLPVKPGL
jgi:hypothetical protein